MNAETLRWKQVLYPRKPEKGQCGWSLWTEVRVRREAGVSSQETCRRGGIFGFHVGYSRKNGMFSFTF